MLIHIDQSSYQYNNIRRRKTVFWLQHITFILQINISIFQILISTQNFLTNNNITLNLLRNSLFFHFNALPHVHIYLCTWNRNLCFRWCAVNRGEIILSRLNYHECPTTCRFTNIHSVAFLFLSSCLMPKNVYPLICIIIY